MVFLVSMIVNFVLEQLHILVLKFMNMRLV